MWVLVDPELSVFDSFTAEDGEVELHDKIVRVPHADPWYSPPSRRPYISEVFGQTADANY
jgi:hypothetical protein